MRNPIIGTEMIILSDSEWWFTSGIMGPTRLWGITDPWLELNEEERNDIQTETKESLLSSGWLDRNNEGFVLHPLLVEMVNICLSSKAILTIQSVNGRIRQHIYLNGDVGLLQNPIAPGLVELSIIPNLSSLLVLLSYDLFPNKEKIGRPPVFNLPAEILLETAQLLLVSKSEESIQRISETNLSEELKSRLIKTLREPYSNMSATLLDYCKSDEQNSIGGFGLLEGEHDLWLLSLDKETVNFEPVSFGMIRRAFIDLIKGVIKE